MAQGSSNLSFNLNKLNNTTISTSSGNADAGTQRVVIASDQPSIFVTSTQTVYGLSNVSIAGTAGQFTCSEKDTTPLVVGQQITIDGTLSGTGSITGYSGPKAYIISQTNGASSFTLITLTGAAIVTTAGTTTGLNFYTRGQQDFNIIGVSRENIASINTKISDGTQKAILRSGAKGTTVAADVTSTSIDTNIQALDVTLRGTGTNTIGKLASNDGVDIGDVTINNASIAVTDNGGSLTVDGTVAISNFPATQPVSIATSVPVTGTFWQATQPVSIATLPALAAGTNNIGDVDVVSLPGTVAADITAIRTATELLDNAIGTDGTAIATGMLRVGGTDGTNNQTISVNTSGHVNIADGGNSITVDGTVGISGTVPVSGTFWQATQPVSLASVPSHPVTNAGTFAVQVDGAALTALQLIDDTVISDNTAIGATKIVAVGGTDGTNAQMLSVNTSGHVNIADGGNSITVDGTVGISGTVPVSGTFWQATQPVSIATLPALAAGTNNIGVVTLSPNTSLANSLANSSTTAYAASLVVKASAGILYIVTGFNSRSSGQFIHLYDAATLPADTAVPKLIFYVEANSNFSLDFGAYGRYFTTGIVISNSSTGPTKKIGAADCWFDVQFE